MGDIRIRPSQSKVSCSILLLTTVFLLPVGGLAFYSLSRMTSTDYAGWSLSEIIQRGDWLAPCFFLPLLLGVIWLMARTFWDSLFPPAIKNGVHTTARVMNFWLTGARAGRDVQVGLFLDYRLPDGSPVDVKTGIMVPWQHAENLKDGMTAEIIYNPARPKRVIVEALVPAPAPAESASSG